MRYRVKLIFLALTMALVMGVTTAGGASAAEMVLPEFKNAESATSASAEGTLSIEGGASIKCKTDSGKEEFNSGSHQLGKYSLEFQGCAEGGETCHSLGGTESTITIAGEWHLVLDVSKEVHIWEALFLLPATDPHIECTKGAVKLFLLLGALLGLLEPGAGKVASEFKVILEGSKGVQGEKNFENNKGESITDSLETSQEGGKQKKSALASELTTLCFSKENEIKN